MAAEDLIAVVFPDRLACAENLSGAREIPDHPLVRQTVFDCSHEAMDIDGLLALLRAIESGDVQVLTRDLPQPSPLAQEILNARPYAFLDDAPLEERRTQAVAARRWLDPETAAQFGQLDPAAIEAVRSEAWPTCENADELHDALMLLGVMSPAEGLAGNLGALFDNLLAAQRATTLRTGSAVFWTAAEQLPMARTVYGESVVVPTPSSYRRSMPPDRGTRGEAVRELLRGRLQAVGPTTASELASLLALPRQTIDTALIALESEGFVLRGRFSAGSAELEWCERRLLARIHRYTIKSLRAQIEPVSSAEFMRFLLDWQGLSAQPRPQGAGSLERVIAQLEGFEAPAVAWESDVLPARLLDYDGSWLDSLCLSGRTYWARLDSPQGAAAAPVRATPIALLTRKHRSLWQRLSPPARVDSRLSASAGAMADYLQRHGASFFDEIMHGAGLLHAQAQSGLAELVAAGRISADSFGGLRALLKPLQRAASAGSGERRRALPLRRRAGGVRLH